MLDMRIYTLLDAPNWTAEPTVRFPSSPIPTLYSEVISPTARNALRITTPIAVNWIRNLKYFKFFPI